MKRHPQPQVNEVRNALRLVQDAKDNLAKVVKAQFPEGSRVAWGHGRSDFAIEGSVLMHGHGGRIKVHSDVTGKEYWIYVERICGA